MNSLTYNADRDPNSVFELTPEAFQILKPTLAKATPESFAKANIIQTYNKYRVEMNFTEEEAHLMRAALLIVKNRERFHRAANRPN
jgi:hypothetical protein